jgi:hypothetical protein
MNYREKILEISKLYDNYFDYITKSVCFSLRFLYRHLKIFSTSQDGHRGLIRLPIIISLYPKKLRIPMLFKEIMLHSFPILQNISQVNTVFAVFHFISWNFNNSFKMLSPSKQDMLSAQYHCTNEWIKIPAMQYILDHLRTDTIQ